MAMAMETDGGEVRAGSGGGVGPGLALVVSASPSKRRRCLGFRPAGVGTRLATARRGTVDERRGAQG